MEQFFYTETMTVMNADSDFRSLLKPSALLRYVEQISTDHARAFGMDDQFFKDRGVTFLVTVSPHLRYCHPGDTKGGQGLSHLVHLVRANDALDQFQAIGF